MSLALSAASISLSAALRGISFGDDPVELTLSLPAGKALVNFSPPHIGGQDDVALALEVERRSPPLFQVVIEPPSLELIVTWPTPSPMS